MGLPCLRKPGSAKSTARHRHLLTLLLHIDHPKKNAAPNRVTTPTRKNNTSTGVGELNSRNNRGAMTIDRNDDTRVRQGPINAAKASDRLLTSSGLPCTKYVANVLDASGIVNTKQQLPGKTYSVEDAINMNKKVLPEATSNEGLDHLVRDYDQRTKGVVHALAEANAGYEIDIINNLNSLKKGDFVQYWYQDEGKRLGHAAVVTESVGADGKVSLRGSQKGVEKTFRTTLNGADFRYAVRPEWGLPPSTDQW